MSLRCFRSLLDVVLCFPPQKVLPKGKVEWSGVEWSWAVQSKRALFRPLDVVSAGMPLERRKI